MKQIPKQEQQDVAGGLVNVPQVPCFPSPLPKLEDAPTCPEGPDTGCESPATL